MIKKLTLVSLLLTSIYAKAQEETHSANLEDFFEMSLEDLMNIEITSASKTAEKLQDVASSIYVLTDEDIQRSGATRITDVLQMVPGAFFIYNDYNNVNTTIREETNAFNGSVLVLIDNVPYQSPLTGAFDFKNFDIDLSEIERIEVIKGPGGTIYGSNAATGIINIFTKTPEKSQGARVTINTGNHGFISPAFRLGSQLNATTFVSAYVKGNHFNGFDPVDEFSGEYVTIPKLGSTTTTVQGYPVTSYNGQVIGDTTIKNKLGDDIYKTDKITADIKLKSELTDKTSLTVGAFYNGHKYREYGTIGTKNSLTLYESNATRLVSNTRLDHKFSQNHSIFGQFSINNENQLCPQQRSSTSVTNFEVQDNFKINRHQFILGANVRQVHYKIGPYDTANVVKFTNPNSNYLLSSAFLQYKITLVHKLDVIAGIKAEYWELVDKTPAYSPNLRLSFKPNSKLNIWGSISRSYTTPSFITKNILLKVSEPMLIEPNILYPKGVLPSFAIISGSENKRSEYNTAEIGAKTSLNKFYFDLSLFYTKANNLIGTAPGFSTIPIPVTSPVNPNEKIIPIYYASVLKATQMGGEFLMKHFTTDWLQLEFSYALFTQKKEGQKNPYTSNSMVVYSSPQNPNIPKHILRMRTYFTLPKDLKISLNAIYNTKSGNYENFIYEEQRVAVAFNSTEIGYSPYTAKNRFRLDFKIEKLFFEGKTSLYLWGTDILNSGTVQTYSIYTSGIPKQTQRLVGLGVSSKF